MMIFIGGTPLGSPLIGWVGEAYGARWTLIAGGALTIAGTALASTLYLRRRRVLTPEPRPSNLIPRVWDNQTVARARNVSD
jgi:MFS family permease